jgi:hypothetical protein
MTDKEKVKGIIEVKVILNHAVTQPTDVRSSKSSRGVRLTAHNSHFTISCIDLPQPQCNSLFYNLRFSKLQIF